MGCSVWLISAQGFLQGSSDLCVILVECDEDWGWVQLLAEWHEACLELAGAG